MSWCLSWRTGAWRAPLLRSCRRTWGGRGRGTRSSRWRRWCRGRMRRVGMCGCCCWCVCYVLGVDVGWVWVCGLQMVEAHGHYGHPRSPTRSLIHT